VSDVDLRKLAAEVVGRAALEERYGSQRVALSAVDAILLHKSAQADRELLQVAAAFDTDSILNVYEDLGGSYASKVRE
jgi:hypothetical protein